MAFGWNYFSKAHTSIAAAALQLEKSRFLRRVVSERGRSRCLQPKLRGSRPTLRFNSHRAALMTLTGCHGRSRDDAANDTGFLLHAASAEVEERSRPTH